MSYLEFKNIIEFEAFTTSHSGLLLIDFYATWCGPCKIMAPIFGKVSEEISLKNITFAKIDRDENQELIQKYGFEIPTIPRFILVQIEQGEVKILSDLGGTQSKTQMVEKLLGFIEPNQTTEVLDQENETTVRKNRVAIIGSGPAGWTAAIYASRANLDVTLYQGPMPGGQLTTTTEIENFPGAWNIETKKGLFGSDLMSTMQDQAKHFGTATEFESIESVQYENHNDLTTFTLTDSLQREKQFDAVIIASGATARYLGIVGEEKYVGKGYHSCATCDGAFYKNKIVAIVGGGDSAMEEAGFLAKFASKVYLLHRSETFRASKVMLERVQKNPKIQIVTNVAVDKFVGEGHLEYLILKNTNSQNINPILQDSDFEKIDDEFNKLVVQGLFVAIGHDPNTKFVANLLDVDAAGYLIPQSRLPLTERNSKYQMATKIPGLFVAGDVEDHEYRQAITAAAGGCRAAMETEKWLAESID